MIEVDKSILDDIYKERPKDAKKYDFGLLIVIGGSEFYSGSPALSAMAAFKAGADMVRIVAPKRAADIIASFSPTMATLPLDGKWLEKKHLATLISTVESAKAVSNNMTAVVIGGGAGRSKETQDTILEFLAQVRCPVVIDADAIHALGKKPDLTSQNTFLITPHTFEFFALTGQKVLGLPEEEKIKLVRDQAARFGATILLKGAVDIISNGQEVSLSRTGSPYMTKGGTGDTLAGICGALLARGLDPFKAAQAAAYLNGKAGELASQKKKDGLLPTDLIDSIPDVI